MEVKEEIELKSLIYSTTYPVSVYNRASGRMIL
jgi:hypothetical protein